jgi:hypothetical protein
MLNDLYHELLPKKLYDATWSADGYSYYVDAQGLAGLAFLIEARMTTADGSNYVTPRIYGTNSATKGTFTNYTECATTEYTGSLSACNDTTVFTQLISIVEPKYRYYCFFLDETSTAVGEISIVALCQGEVKPSSGLTVATGAVS